MLKRLTRGLRHPVKAIQRQMRRRWDIKRAALRALKVTPTNNYQLLFGVDEAQNTDVRPFLDRWNAIEPHMPLHGSALDVGCSAGWLSFKLAERGLLTLGLDSNIKDIQAARMLAIYHDHPNVAFMRWELSPTTAADLPEVDVGLCLSVFHHLVRYHSRDYAEKSMQGLAQRIRRMIVFDTGQSNETDQTWVDHLSFMNPDPVQWVEDYVRSLGFDRVIRLGLFPGFRTDAKRVLVLGERV